MKYLCNIIVYGQNNEKFASVSLGDSCSYLHMHIVLVVVITFGSCLCENLMPLLCRVFKW